MNGIEQLKRRAGDLEEQRDQGGSSWKAWVIWLSVVPLSEQRAEVRRMLKMGGRFTDEEIEPGIDNILAGVAGYHGID